MEHIISLLDKDLAKLESLIEILVTTKVDLVRKIVYHIIRSGGKRVRPILVILTSKLCQYGGNQHILYAAVIEFIHTATLLHDDVVDNASTRRGASTANTLWGNQPSVLVGDYLYSKSFEVMADDGNVEVLKTISKATTALSEGEILEILKTADIDTTEDDYFKIIHGKTAVLFAAACEIGGILGNIEKEKREALRDFGEKLGIIFQLIDDVLDYTSEDAVLGKHVGTDLKEHKLTLPLIYALKSATAKERSLIEKVLGKPNVTQNDFKKVTDLIQKYGGIEYTLAKTNEFKESAIRLLDIFPHSDYKDALISLTEFMVKRRK